MTKYELGKKVESLERDLHNSQNSVEYWQEEAEAYCKLLRDLENKIDAELVLSFIKDCSITQKQQLEDFIKTL